MMIGGPANMPLAERCNISPNESDINSDMSAAETNVVENYAPLNEEDSILMDDNRYVYYYNPDATSCDECHMGDDRYIYRPSERCLDKCLDAPDDYEYDDRYADVDYEDYEDDPIREGMIENMDSDCDSTYKYLFYLLLIIIIIVFIYNYKK